MRPVARRLRLHALIALSALCLLLAACEDEEEIKLNADGSGTYRARILVEKEVGDALQEVRKELQARGATVVEEGETENRKFIVVSRDFKSVSELNDKDDTYALAVERSGLLKAAYHLTLNFRDDPSSSGFSRTVQVTMPADIENSTAGTVAGRTVRWDCSKPGTLDVQAAGMVLPLTGSRRALAVGVLLLGAMLLVGLRVARRKPRVCGTCGARLQPDARFCRNCGTQRDEEASPAAGAPPSSS
jgi:LppM domain/zinc-ribbon domain